MWWQLTSVCASRFLYNIYSSLSFLLSSLLFVTLVISVSLFDQFCTSSLFCSGNHSMLGTLTNATLIKAWFETRIILFSLRLLKNSTSSHHENPRTEAHAAFHTRIGTKVHALSKGSFIFFYWHFCSPAWRASNLRRSGKQTNKVFPVYFVNCVLEWEWPALFCSLDDVNFCTMKTYHVEGSG